MTSPPVHGIGAEAANGQALPAGHAVQLNFAPPSEYIPAGQGIFVSLQNLKKTLRNKWTNNARDHGYGLSLHLQVVHMQSHDAFSKSIQVY